MRFDDSLQTVLASDSDSGFGAQATWRQLVDLGGRGRIAVDAAMLRRLRALRPSVPTPTRAASARALAFAHPPAPLVALFAEDELAIAAPVLRTATLPAADWLEILPLLTPTGRSVLRHRRDLAPEIVRGLESFGTVDFVLDHEAPIEAVAAPAPAAAAAPVAAEAPLADTPFQPLGDVARHIPIVAEALRRADAPEPVEVDTPGAFAIADLKARIDAYQQRQPAIAPPPVREADSFRFETDATGSVRWVEGAPRTGLVGLSLAYAAPQGLAQVDEVATAAFRRRSRIADGRLTIEGDSPSAGAWRLAAMPSFDPASGRFAGYRGVARRSRGEGAAERQSTSASESLRQLVHELRTPTNAIAGFAELIETQLLGPVAPPYRERAETIRHKTASLLAAIEDLDTAARIEGHALDLRASEVPIEPMIARILADLAPLARVRGAGIAFAPAGEHVAQVDDRAAERLVGRLLAALLSAAAPGERLMLNVEAKVGAVALHVDRPAALVADLDDTLLSIDAQPPLAEGEGAPLLGTGFALRLARNLAAELGGSLSIGPRRLTLRLPTALIREVERAAH